MRLHFQCEHRAVVLEEVAIRFQPQQVAHPDPEFRSVDRFAQELFRSGIEDGQARIAVDLRGHHDDRDIPTWPTRLSARWLAHVRPCPAS